MVTLYPGETVLNKTMWFPSKLVVDRYVLIKKSEKAHLRLCGLPHLLPRSLLQQKVSVNLLHLGLEIVLNKIGLNLTSQ